MANVRKNIKIVTFGNFPFGGASANLLRYISFSLNQENDVEVILPTGGYFGNKIDVNNKRTGAVNGVKYIHTGFVLHPKNIFGKVLDNLIGPFLMFFLMIKRNIKKRIDVIIVYNTTFTKTAIFLFLRLFFRFNYIVILPEFYSKPKMKLFSIAQIKWINYIFGMRLIKYADSYIVASYYLKNYIIEELKDNAKVLVLPNAMDPTVFDISDSIPYKEGFITIGYVGTPTRKDGARDLIKSFGELNKKYNNLHLLIIGDITNGNTLIPELQMLAKSVNAIDKITFTGLVPFSKVPELLNKCQILALTRPTGRFAEAGFPTKLGEYFACKIPVVITRVGDIGRYFTNEKEVILVEPENIDSIVRGFEKLILSESLRKRISRNAYDWMDNNLNYRNIANILNSFI